MTMRRGVLGLAIVSILVIGIGLLGSVTGAGAETMKIKGVTTATKAEILPVGDEEGHVLGLQMLEGLSLFENGEIAKTKSWAISDRDPAKGIQASGYILTTFADGSTILQKIQRTMTPDKNGIFSATMTGEMVKGTGRFEGIKGTTASTGKNFMPGKGEAMILFTEMTYTYTLPPK